MIATPANLAVRLENVAKSFGAGKNAEVALRGVDLELEAGRLLVVTGPSGCGKTTLLSIISGMLTPSSGRAEAFGIQWAALGENQKTLRRGEIVGYMFQHFHLIPTLPIAMNVALPLVARGCPHRRARAKAEAALERVGLGRRCKAFPRELSGGMQQRVALARALVGEPRLLVCDEPTANLDRETGATVLRLIYEASRGRDEQGRPRSVVLVSHDMGAMRVADEVFRMVDGRGRRVSLEEAAGDAWDDPPAGVEDGVVAGD